VTVGNTGRGIPPDCAAHIFDRFYRGDQSRTRKRPGHGLGLSICREIARAHRGEIKLSDYGASWTELCVTLPVEDGKGDPPSSTVRGEERPETMLPMNSSGPDTNGD
jgi:signal transduction histidine kinase